MFLENKTAWVMPDPNGKGFVARLANGAIIARHKHKSSVHYIVRKDAIGLDIWAIADVVDPNKRQPNRALPRSKSRMK